MRVLVCGGRTFDQPRAVGRALAKLHADTPIKLLISGGAPGADRLAENWAARGHIPVSVYPAHWQSMGQKAGPVRNGWMLELGLPDVVVAFPGGTGTQNMIAQARAAGIAVIEPGTESA